MFAMTYTGRASTPFIHSKRLSPTQDRECRRVSPRKTNKSLHYKKMLRLGRGVQTTGPAVSIAYRAGSLCLGWEKRTMHTLEVQIGNSGYKREAS